HSIQNRHNSSNSRFAASNEVISPLSYGGETSTKSHPTRSNPLRLRTKSRICALESPPTCGVPVPGANAGPTTSISKVTYVGRVRNFFNGRFNLSTTHQLNSSDVMI